MCFLTKMPLRVLRYIHSGTMHRYRKVCVEINIGKAGLRKNNHPKQRWKLQQACTTRGEQSIRIGDPTKITQESVTSLCLAQAASRYKCPQLPSLSSFSSLPCNQENQIQWLANRQSKWKMEKQLHTFCKIWLPLKTHLKTSPWLKSEMLVKDVGPGF